MLNFCDFIQVFVFTTNDHLNWDFLFGLLRQLLLNQLVMIPIRPYYGKLNAQ